jgi:hypothetical protein
MFENIMISRFHRTTTSLAMGRFTGRILTKSKGSGIFVATESIAL